MAVLVFVVLFLVYKECTLVAFDGDYARVTGYPIWVLDGIVYLLLVLVISIGLHMVGVILMSTIIVAPAAAARQWTTTMRTMALVSGLFGACAVVGGIMMSSVISHMPTGPCMVVVASTIVGISLLFAPQRGLCVQWMQGKRSQ
jgi:manganese/zinc/iron transport system permease protein